MGYNLIMEKKKQGYIPKRKNRTGEDIDMLFEKEIEPENSGSGSYKYRDHIDSY